MKNLWTIKEAQEKTVFVVEDNEVVETSLYDHVMRSVDETTSPRGVEARVFVEEVFIKGDPYSDDPEDQEDYRYWTISTWGVRGNNYHRGDEKFETEKEANDELFRRVYEYDFLPDDQRVTYFYNTLEEAEEDLKELLNE